MSSTKCLIVGDGAIGKTCLLTCFTNESINFDDGEPEYEPTTFNNFILEWNDPSKGELQVEMWDTAGQEAFEQLRKLSYPGTDIFLIGYSCVSSTSLNNIQHKWLTEITSEGGNENAWTIVVGTKVDLRDSTAGAVSTAQAEDLCKNINACAFVETSAKAKTGIDKLTALMMELAFMKLANGKRPDFGHFSESAPSVKVETTSVKENTKTPSPEELEAGKKAEAEHKAKLEKENAAATKTKDPNAGGSKTNTTDHAKDKQEQKEKKGGDQCSCVIA